MKQILYYILLAVILMISGCGSTKKLPVTVSQSDSVRIETRYIKYTERDTVYLEIPAQTAERTTRDSSSRLENDYAISDARINADGTLFHDLKTKPQKKPVPTEKQVERKDSIVYVDKKVEVPVPVERELNWWEKTSIKLFPLSLTALLMVVVFIFRKPILNLIRRFI